MYLHVINWEMLPGDKEHEGDIAADAGGGIEDAKKCALGCGVGGAEALLPGIPALLVARVICESTQHPQEIEIPVYNCKSIYI